MNGPFDSAKYLICAACLLMMVGAISAYAQNTGADAMNVSELWRAQVTAFRDNPTGDTCRDARLNIIEYLRDHGITRSTLLSAAYVNLGRDSIAEGDRSSARWAFEAALQVDSEYIPAANAAVVNGFRMGIGTGFSAMFRRIGIFFKHVSELRPGIIILGNIAQTLQTAVILIVTVIIAVILIRNFPLIVHEVSQWIPGKINAGIVAVVVAAILIALWFTPLAVVGSLLLWLALAMLFSDKSHRMSLWTGWLLLFLIFPLTWLNGYSIRFSESRYIRIKEYVVSGGYSEPAIRELTALLERPGNDRYRDKLYYMLGLLYKRGGFYSDAKMHYGEYIERAPAESRGYINLGNIAFIEDRIKSAAELYRRAESLDPRNPIIFYNLSKVYMSQFRFDDARDMQRRASQLDRERINRLSENQSSKPVRMMVDASVPDDWFHDELSHTVRGSFAETSEYWNPRYIQFGFMNALLGYGLMTVILIILSWLAERLKLSRYCLKCGKAMKPDDRAGGTDFVCVNCHMVYFKKGAATGASREVTDKVKKKTRDWNRVAHRLFSCVVPGAGRIYSGKQFGGLVMLGVWSVCISLFLTADHRLPLGYRVPAGGPRVDVYVLALCLLLIYAISIIWGFREEEV